MTNYLDVLDAQRGYFDAQIGLSNAIRDELIAVVQAVEESYDMEGELDAADLKKYIDELVMQLPPRQREVFRMSRELHMSNREIAEHFSITEKAIERHINLALKFLKKNLNLFMLFMAA